MHVQGGDLPPPETDKELPVGADALISPVLKYFVFSEKERERSGVLLLCGGTGECSGGNGMGTQ